jgi:putative sterol carrier protein
MTEQANHPVSEQFRLAAKDWVEKDSAANLLEETKSAVLSQMMARLGDIPVSHAERAVKSSEEWMDFITKMVRAREAANLAKVRCEFIRMKFSEWQSHNANKRAEMRL